MTMQNELIERLKNIKPICYAGAFVKDVPIVISVNDYNSLDEALKDRYQAIFTEDSITSVLNEQPRIELESTIILNKYGLSLVEKLHSTLKKTLEDLEQFKKQKNGK